MKKQETKDWEDPPRPPPNYQVKYIQGSKQDKTVKIDLTQAANRNIDLLRTGWTVHQGQKIIVQDFELKGGNFVWDHDFSSCKETY